MVRQVEWVCDCGDAVLGDEYLLWHNVHYYCDRCHAAMCMKVAARLPLPFFFDLARWLLEPLVPVLLPAPEPDWSV